MNKRRKTRFPGVYLLEDGRFQIRVTTRCSRTGKMLERQQTLEHGHTLGQAVDAMEAIRVELRQDAAPTSKRHPTVRDYAERWLEGKAARVRPGVSERYARCLTDHLLPHFGDLYLDSITRSDVEAWVAWAEKVHQPDGSPYSPATIRGWWRVLRCLLQDAAAEHSLFDPTNRVRPPDPGGDCVREQRTLSSTQLRALLEAAQARFPHRLAEISTLAMTGMRPGELYALRWQDVDFGQGVITISRASWGQHVDRTKTRAPRQVPIHPRLVELLQAHRRDQLASQHPGLSTGLVFPSDNGRLRYNNSLKEPLGKLARHIGLQQRVTPQVLRRTFNTLMLEAGIDRVVLRSMMGHSSEQMTTRYAGVRPDLKAKAVALLLK